ncbi:hypothetical protein DPX16_9154 [Anabarilius grahami]|uniref:Uncharacterized protein n=1 Tax=Anabarilius grahami TaxID=495550 RepID=A0A3N0YBD7_ANAGA|nr:hypothetical protein DPX16_9154 [Anabarilius grahami]
MEHWKLFEKALEGLEMTPSKPQTSDNRKHPATKVAQPRKRVLQISSSSEMTSGSTTSPEASVMYLESGASTLDSDQDDAKEKSRRQLVSILPMSEGTTSSRRQLGSILPMTVEGKGARLPEGTTSSRRQLGREAHRPPSCWG